MELRKYQPGDEKRILELFKLVFRQEMSEEYWNWRFLSNPFTKDKFIYLMWEGDELIGHYAVSPVEMNMKGELIKSALSMTTMTHPQYGGKGIFSKLAAALYEDLKNKYGYKLIWGFPNNNSHYGFIKNLGWQDVAIIPMFSMKLTESRINLGERVSYKLMQNFEEEITKQLNNSENKFSINKTREYLQWRYVQNPDVDYKILQLSSSKTIVVYKSIESLDEKGKYEIDILEILIENKIDNLTGLINAILINENKNQIIKFNIWKSLFSEERLLFEKLGFKNTLPLTYLSFLKLNNIAEVEKFQTWEIGMGYSDVF